MVIKAIRFIPIFIGLFLFITCAEEQVSQASPPIGSYTRTFNDLNDLHKNVAERRGIKPISSRNDLEKQTKKLKELDDNKYYMVANLTHSLPYLVPSAEKLLADIGKDFQRRLKSKKLSLYRIRVTSVLRTQDDIKRLNRRNSNSSSNSAHIHATTFDVSYVRFDKLDESDDDVSQAILKKTLAESLRYLREKERCYVKYEVKQGCFHITAR